MTEPDRPVDDEQPDLGTGPAERDIEAPEADAAEQATPVTPPDGLAETQLSPEADEYDAVEQRRVVLTDEDDYR